MALPSASGRTKAYYLREIIEPHICDIRDVVLRILVVQVGNRREIYNKN